MKPPSDSYFYPLHSLHKRQCMAFRLSRKLIKALIHVQRVVLVRGFLFSHGSRPNAIARQISTDLVRINRVQNPSISRFGTY